MLYQAAALDALALPQLLSTPISPTDEYEYDYLSSESSNAIVDSGEDEESSAAPQVQLPATTIGNNHSRREITLIQWFSWLGYDRESMLYCGDCCLPLRRPMVS